MHWESMTVARGNFDTGVRDGKGPFYYSKRKITIS